MKTQRAAVVHFDNNPFLLNFWLKLYEKYWRKSINKLYVSFNPRRGVLNEGMFQDELKLLATFPEIEVFCDDKTLTPESGMNYILPQVKEDYVMFVESDGWIFGENIVEDCFKKLEGEYDIVGGPYGCWSKKYADEWGYEGFMRNFFFVKKSLLDQIEINFYPYSKVIDGIEQGFDCFGWVAFQLALLKPNISFIPCNVIHPNNNYTDIIRRNHQETQTVQNGDYKNYPYLHIRSMSSSSIGMGGDVFKKAMNKESLDEFKDNVYPGNTGEWGYAKSLAFSNLMADYFPDHPFYKTYKETLKYIQEQLLISFDKMNDMQNYYKELIKI